MLNADFWAQWRSTIEHWRSVGADTRIAKCLTNYDIETVEQLAKRTDEELLSMVGFGDKSLARVHTILRENGHPRDVHPIPTMAVMRRLNLNSLLLAYESHTLALYDLQRADRDPDDFLDIERDATIVKRKAAIEKVREDILAFAERG